ncbi:MAG: hypothetical protein M1816_000714 [Peltula sp. TS41687]|nr:MAG: hypothetical protein M1816_000714 [Peltula sp. TS41687]
MVDSTTRAHKNRDDINQNGVDKKFPCVRCLKLIASTNPLRLNCRVMDDYDGARKCGYCVGLGKPCFEVPPELVQQATQLVAELERVSALPSGAGRVPEMEKVRKMFAAEGGSAEDTGQQQDSMADPPVQPEQERGRSLTPASNGYDEIELRGDDEKALQHALKGIQKKRRVADLHRQMEAERKALDEGVPPPTITGMIRRRSDTSATIAPAPKRSRRNGSDLEDDSRLRVTDPKTYEGKNQGELRQTVTRGRTKLDSGTSNSDQALQSSHISATG